MLELFAAMLLVLLADQGLKLLLRRRLGNAAVSLGPLGRVFLVESKIWLARTGKRLNAAIVWGIWCSCALMLLALSFAVPALGGFAGLLLGGSCSHAMETTVRGRVSDYVCLRFWPAFNGADVAITVGSAGLAFTMLRLIVAA